MLVSVDPGLRACGVAAFDGRSLLWAGYVKNTDEARWYSMVHAVDNAVRDRCQAIPSSLVIEIPQIYVQSRWKGDQNDIVMLAGLVGAFVYFFDVREGSKIYRPAEWKGQVTKEITELRMKKRLSAEELEKVILPPAKSLVHNVWDAVGLGLHHLER